MKKTPHSPHMRGLLSRLEHQQIRSKYGTAVPAAGTKSGCIFEPHAYFTGDLLAKYVDRRANNAMRRRRPIRKAVDFGDEDTFGWGTRIVPVAASLNV